ncbi:phosphoenolpyruvate--protein phosphotransferase [Nitriliruptor alkaliphilus]|uniref:phosphoenolpyruvate--protein phosphotransferase n=1 Tax=Nitriliruptor alkaliphilus TaxID=427918 RepID=UPI000697D39D|nr:phosphoenolpyruvate--protein phosphotransferase [Nitriliruptor alkaliphilus]
MSTSLRGRPAAPGVAFAPAVVVGPVLGSDHDTNDPERGDPARERERLDAALTEAVSQLRALAQRVAHDIGEDEAEIFEAHADFGEDPELVDRARKAIAQGTGAVTATRNAFDGFRELLAASSSELLSARAADLDDVRDRVVALLLGRPTELTIPDEPSVIVAHELTPSQTAGIPRDRIAAVVTETGSPTSHAAILARALGVPAVVGVSGLLAVLTGGTTVAVDGRSGEVTIDPDAEARADLEARAAEEHDRRTSLDVLRDEPGRTADGRRVELAANLGGLEDLPAAVAAGAEGSGLLRTEVLYLDRVAAPSVDEQTEVIARILRTFPGHRVVVRTLDVGADKPLPFVARDDEPNPALGLRGIRLSLARPTLFRDQLRALLRAKAAVGSDGARLAIMFPMVSVPSELDAAREHLRAVAEEEGIGLDDVEVGVMVETPAAALSAERLAARADFLSIGTNDLLQYAFAADRLVAGVADLADACDPAILRLLGDVVAAGHRHGAWVGVCGEAASDPAVAVALVGAGADELSMTRVAIPEVKATLRAITQPEAEAALAEALTSDDATGARAVLAAAVDRAVAPA